MSDTSSDDPFGDGSSEGDGPTAAQDDRNLSCWDLLAARLDQVRSLGDFATIHRYSRVVNPTLKVNDAIVPLPLTPRDAEHVRTTCRPAPFGRGDATVVDSSVRRTWELSPDQFTLANPEWTSFLSVILDDVAGALGIHGAGEVAARLHKLLLYEEGSFFRPHKDSEKEEGMVATLVICLPSEHTGGDVHLRHGTKRHTLTTSTSSIFTTTALAWYSDVTHEVREVTSGYRLALVYNLVQTSGVSVSAGLFDRQLSELGSAIATCRNEDPGFSRRLYALDHQYSKTSLSFNNLKARDGAVCQILASHCSRNGFYLLLANLTRVEEHDVDEPDTEIGLQLSMDSVRACDGSELARNIQFHEDELLNNPYDDTRQEDDFQESEHLGNDESPEVFKYYDAAAMICPKGHLASYLHLFGNIELENMMRMVMKDLEVHPDAAGQQQALDFLLKTTSSFAVDLGLIVDWAYDHDQKLLAQAMKSAISRNQFASSMRTLAEKFSRDYDSAEASWDECLGGYMESFQQPDDLCEGLKILEASLDERLKPSFAQWKLDVLRRTLQAQDVLRSNVRRCVMTLATEGTVDDGYFRTRILPLLRERGSRVFIISLLKDVLDGQGLWASKMPDVDRKALALEVLKATQPLTALQAKDLSADGSESVLHDMAVHLTIIWSKTPDDMIEDIIATSCTNLAEAHIGTSDAPLDASRVDQFLVRLYEVLAKRNILAGMVPLKVMYERLIRRYVYGPLVPDHPEKQHGWRLRPANTCSPDCPQCGSLHEFLLSDKEVMTFTMEGSAYYHFWSLLPDTVENFRERLGSESDDKPEVWSWTVIKRPEDVEFGRELRRYEGRLHRLESRMRRYRGEYMKALLGDDVYRELVLLENVRDSGGWKMKTAAAASAASGASSNRMRKRKASDAGILENLAE